MADPWFERDAATARAERAETAEAELRHEVKRLQDLVEEVTREKFRRVTAAEQAAYELRRQVDAVRALRERYGAMVVPLNGQFNAGKAAALMHVIEDLDAALDAQPPAEGGPEPRTWNLPPAPGPEVTAVLDCSCRRWERVDRGWQLCRDRGLQPIETWWALFRANAPLTEAPAALDTGQPATGETP